MRPLVTELGAHFEIGGDPHRDQRSAYSWVDIISFIELFHDSLEQGKAFDRAEIDGSAYTPPGAGSKSGLCLFAHAWSSSLFNRTVRARELGLRYSIARTQS